MLDGILFQARGLLYLKDCLVIINLQNEGIPFLKIAQIM